METFGASGCERIVPLPAGAPCPVHVQNRSSCESRPKYASFSFARTKPNLRRKRHPHSRSAAAHDHRALTARVPQRGGCEYLHNDVVEPTLSCPFGKARGHRHHRQRAQAGPARLQARGPDYFRSLRFKASRRPTCSAQRSNMPGPRRGSSASATDSSNAEKNAAMPAR